VPTPLSAAASLVRNRALTAADTWERHLVVAELVGPARQVVDVGGLPGQLASFLPGASVVAANISQPADLLVEPGGLPFKDRSIEVVTSLDALEHVPPADRPRFVAELVRVARRRLVLCCPFGGPEHAAAEREVQRWHEELTGDGHPWLAEHLELGLPTQEELEACFAPARAAGDDVRFRYHGDFRATNEQFRRIVAARRRPRPGSVLAYGVRRLAHRPDTELTERPTPYTNRVFAVVDRASSARS
jgi:Methyltransferase domain